MKTAFAILFVCLLPVATQAQQEQGDYAVGLSLGSQRAGIFFQYFVSDDVALELYGYSLGYLGAGAVIHPVNDDDLFAVISLTRIAGPRLPFAPVPTDDEEGPGPRARYVLSAGGGTDFGHLGRRDNGLRGNTRSTFFFAAGPSYRFGPQPPARRQRGFLQPARRLGMFYQLGLKSFYR